MWSYKSKEDRELGRSWVMLDLARPGESQRKNCSVCCPQRKPVARPSRVRQLPERLAETLRLAGNAISSFPPLEWSERDKRHGR